MRKLGLIMHDVEDVIMENLKASECATALDVVHQVLKKNHRKSQEVYTQTGASPVFRLKGKIAKTKVKRLVKMFTPIVREFCKDHDLQWGDVLSLVDGYLRVHYVRVNYIFSYESK